MGARRQSHQCECVDCRHGVVGYLGDQLDVFLRGKTCYEVVELEHEAHVMPPEVRNRIIGRFGKVQIAEPRMARRGTIQSAQYVEQRGFA
jgi:hypothetical protein